MRRKRCSWHRVRHLGKAEPGDQAGSLILEGSHLVGQHLLRRLCLQQRRKRASFTRSEGASGSREANFGQIGSMATRFKACSCALKSSLCAPASQPSQPRSCRTMIRQPRYQVSEAPRARQRRVARARAPRSTEAGEAFLAVNLIFHEKWN